ncbi:MULTISPECIES: endonuclease domain-containing protein [Pseudomonas]|uniref:DNA methyltransferase n=1 Tax=Pseudomonas nitroreducens TaxID=46680 RepID=A0A2D0AF38_PSENT|nr:MULTISPECIES: endonuclease domain-containing protein [Pseudomonas]MCG8911104.1 endonuclease domain-containing protein [Pseudomonas sp. DP-17]OWP50720.1 DNA methyltransferase [Pseudomonas nitroreducens]
MSSHLTRFSKQLRTDQTEAERALWHQLRAHRFLGLKFRRQKIIGPYIIDFICHERMLIIELDGGQHLDSDADQERDAWLRNKGFTVLRFWNHDVLLRLGAVLEAISLALDAGSAPSPQPSP